MTRAHHRHKRVLVTGGAGFLGSHLCDRLIELGNEVVCVDNFFTGERSNVEHLMDGPSFELIRHDVTFPLYVEVDEIYNLACPASPIHYQRDPVQTIKTSVHGAINMLGLAKRVGARILQASTSEVYGDPLVHPQPESYWGNVNPIGERACYDEGKRCAETLCVAYAQRHQVDARIARIFNTYGPRMSQGDGRVISNFIVATLRNEPIILHDGGVQSRSFCFVDDMVTGLINLMATNGRTRPVNLGSPHEVSIAAVWRKILSLIPESRSLARVENGRSDDPLMRQPDLSLAREMIGWDPKVSLHDGLVQTIAYFKEALCTRSC